MSINGTNNSETLWGTLGDDLIDALGGNDMIHGSQGNDSVNGGFGADLLIFTLADTSLFAAAAAARNYTIGSSSVTDSSSLLNTSFASVEHITFSLVGAGNYADSIDASGFNPSALTTSTLTILLGDGHTSVIGSWGNDIITTGRGDNVVNASFGTDTILGSQGHDFIDSGHSGAFGDRLIFSMSRADLFDAATGARTYTITADHVGDSSGTINTDFVGVKRITLSTVGTGDFDDIIDASGMVTTTAGLALTAFLGNGNNTVTGSNYADFISTGLGINTVDAGGGVDEVRVGFANGAGDTLYVTGSGGIVTTEFGGVVTNTVVNAENVAIQGSDFSAAVTRVDASGLTGFSGLLIFYDNNGSNISIGSSGSDIFANVHGGEAGNDVYTGNGGADVYDYTWAVGAMDGDTISDLDADDVIDFMYNNATQNGGGLLANLFIGASNFTGVAGQYRYFASGGRTFVQADTNGDGLADETLTVSNGQFALGETFAGSNILKVIGTSGTNGSNTLHTTLGNDSVYAQGGNDMIFGSQGTDFVDGGAGNGDRLVFLTFDASKITPATGSRNYVISANSVTDSSGLINTSFVGIERVNINSVGGGDFGDSIDASGFVTNPNIGTVVVLTLGNGDDTVIGSAYSDSIFTGRGSNFVNAVGGYDYVQTQDNMALGTQFVTGSGNTLITTQNGVATNTILNAESVSVGVDSTNPFVADGLTYTVDASGYTGSAQILFFDHNGDDIFIGSSGADIFSNLYNATIGNDTYTGNGGADIYDYTVAVNALNNDVITDFDSDDIIDFQFNDGIVADQLRCQFWIGSAAFSGVIGQYRYEASGGQTFIQLDTNGDAVADRTLTISNGQFAIGETFAGSNILKMIGTSGTSSADTLTGTLGDDSIYGQAGDDIIYAQAGNDIVNGGQGNDFIDGGGDNDTATYANASGGVVVGLGGGTASGADGNDILVSIENVTGSQFTDTITGNGESNVLDGLGGDDFLTGAAGDDTIFGGDGNDSLLGDFGENNLSVTGNDSLYGGNGNDFLRGGLGDDLLYGGANNDLLRGNGGVDYFDGGSDDGEGFNGIGDRVGFFELRATQGVVADLRDGTISNDGFGNVETMVGIESLGGDTAFVDTFYGNDGRNYLSASRGDYLYGFGGDDLLQTAAAAAVVDGGSGIDRLLLVSSGGWLTPDTNGDGLAESSPATASWNVNLAAGTTRDGYGNSGTVTGIENVTGSVANESIFGDDNANVFEGGNGHDRLISSGGDDSLYGGSGNDILKGEMGDDLLDGGTGIDRAGYYQPNAALGGVTVSLLLQGQAQYVGSEGWDTLISIENVFGTPFADILTGDGGDNWLQGSEATIAGIGVSATNNDTMDGGGGNDMLQVGIGNHTLIGGSGIDTLWFTENGFSETGITVSLALPGTAQSTGNGNWTLTGIENLAGGVGDDTLTGDDGVNVLAGNAGNDTLMGGAGNDSLYGDGAYQVVANVIGNSLVNASLPGNDTLEGGLGDDFLDGGGGSDTASYASASGAVQVDLGLATATGAAGNDTLVSIENVIGSQFGDVILGNALNNVLEGRGGNDIIHGSQGTDYIDGGLGGGDRLFMNTGTGSLFTAATGARTYTIGANSITDSSGTLNTSFVNVERIAFSTVGNGDFNDVIDASGYSSAHLFGLDIRLGNGDNVVTGSAANDRVFTGFGSNTVNGGPGGYDHGFINVDASSDVTITISKVGGTLVTQANGVVNQFTNVDEVWVQGVGAGAVTLDASAYTGVPGLFLVLVGHNGTDIMLGSSGNDFFANITGQVLGSDVYTGNGGADIYDYTYAADSMYGDTITDFDIDDVIDFRFNTLLPGQSPVLANIFIGDAAFSGTAGEYRYQIDGTHTIIEMDSNGDGLADQVDANGDGIIDPVLTITNGGFDLAETFAGSNILTLAESIDVEAGLTIDGYLAGATVFIDTDGDLTLDAGEAWTTTDGAGNFVLSTNQQGTLVAFGGINTDTSLANTMTLAAPDGSGIISPLTTLIQAVIDADDDGSTTAAQAQAMVLAALGLDPSLDLLTLDLIAAAATNPAAFEAQQAAAMIANLVSAVDQADGADADTEGLLVGALADLVTSGGGEIDLTDPATLTPLLTEALPSSTEIAAIASEAALEGDAIAAASSIDDISEAQLAAQLIDYSLDNVFSGDARANHLFGLGGNDTLIGLDGRDILEGGNGDDRLIGGDGLDHFYGGSGNDIFVAEVTPTQAATKLGMMSFDVIFDFAAGDKIDVSGMDANWLQTGDQQFSWKGTNANKAAGDLSYKTYTSVQGAEKALGIDIDGVAGASPYSGPVTIVYGNVDGGTADFAIALLGVGSLSSSDFIFG